MSDEQQAQQTQQADDPSGDGWRDVEVGEILQPYDMFRDGHNVWAFTENTGVTVRDGWQRKYRRRIEPQQASDSEPETMEQLREQVLTLTQERERLQSWLQQHHTTGQQSAIKKLERWLKPVLKVVSDHPDDTSILAVSVLEFLPQIAGRLIEE